MAGLASKVTDSHFNPLQEQHSPEVVTPELPQKIMTTVEMREKGWNSKGFEWSGRRESNPPLKLGKLSFYR